MTEAAKANRSPASKAASGRRNAPAKKTPAVRPGDNEDADIRAGEAAMRDAARLSGTAPGRKAQERRTASTKESGTAHKTATARGRRTAQAIARQPTPVSEAERSAIPVAGGLDVWMGAAGQFHEAGLRAGTVLAESQLTAARSAAAFSARLADIMMAGARTQLDVVRSLISVAEFQRRAAREAFNAALGQAARMRAPGAGPAGSRDALGVRMPGAKGRKS